MKNMELLPVFLINLFNFQTLQQLGIIAGFTVFFATISVVFYLYVFGTRINKLTAFKANIQQPFPAPGSAIFEIQNLNKSFLEDFQFVDDNYCQHQYVRQQSRDLNTFLIQRLTDHINNANNPLLTVATVAGAHGCGKSSETWGWFQLQQTRSRAWVHLWKKKKSKYGVVLITYYAATMWSVYQKGLFTDIDKVVQAINVAEIVVLDGAFDTEYDEMLEFAKKRNKFLVTVISGRAPYVKPAMSRHFDNTPFIVNGFELEDYLAAEPLLAPLNARAPYTNAEIENRFFYCGGSGGYFWRSYH
jgi:hypothetical protein